MGPIAYKLRLARLHEGLRRWLPSRGNVLFTLLIVAALLIANRAGALTLAAPTASTTTIPYQGRLADTGGNPLTGTYAMTFRLYAATSGGSALWTETWTGGTGVRVNAGLFNVMLGSYTPIPQTVVTGNSTLWLGITVGADAEMQPRVQLGSVPFAVQALTVPDGSITNVKIASGSVTPAKTTQYIYEASASIEVTTTYSGNLTYLPPLSITVPASQVPVPLKTLVLFTARCRPVEAGAVVFKPELNGVHSAMYIDAYPTAGQMLVYNLHQIYTLQANQNNTIRILWGSALGTNTSQCYERTLTVIVLGQ